MERNENKKTYNKFYLLGSGLFIFLLLIGSIFLPSFLLETSDGDSLSLSLYNLISSYQNILAIIHISLLSLSIVIFIILTLISDKKKLTNILTIICSVTFLLSFISYFLITYLISYTNNTLEGLKVDEIITILYIALSVILFIIILSFYSKETKLFNTKDIAEISIMLALALVLDKIKIGIGETGGSINASAFPLILISLRFGFIKGFISSSILFGLISNLLDGYGIITYPFDYFIGFSFYSAPGLFYDLFKRINFDKKNDKSILFNDQISLVLSLIFGQILSFLARMVGGSMSSMILYNYTLEAALIYNVVYVGVSALTCLVLGLILVPVISRLNKRFETKHLHKLNLLLEDDASN